MLGQGFMHNGQFWTQKKQQFKIVLKVHLPTYILVVFYKDAKNLIICTF